MTTPALLTDLFIVGLVGYPITVLVVFLFGPDVPVSNVAILAVIASGVVVTRIVRTKLGYGPEPPEGATL